MPDTNEISIFSSANRVDIPVYPHDIFTATDAGSAEITSGGTKLPPEALSILVMLDGTATVGDVEQKLSHIAAEAVRDTLRSLLGAKLVRAMTMAEAGDIGVDFAAFFSAAKTDPDTSIGTQASAGKEAAVGTPRLERQGYYVSIARQALKPPAIAAGSRLRAFIVEDDPDVSALVSRLLEQAGFEVSVAANKEQVLQRLRQAPSPDVMLLDVQLPDLNGFDLLKRLKMHPALKAVPAVMLTADAKRESIIHGLAIGADGYITKPFEQDALLRGVRAVLGMAD